MRVAVRWASRGLSEALARLTPQQARGVVRIVGAELDGRPLSSLLDCAGQICTSTTFYGSGRRKGWNKKPIFQEALGLARRDYREWMLEHGTGEALSILASTAPDAARVLRQRVVGNWDALAVLMETLGAQEPGVRASAATCLGATGLPEVVGSLQRALQGEADKDVRGAIIEALGLVAGGLSRDMAAAESVLSRADLRTAAKGMRELTGEVDVRWTPDLGKLGDEDLARLREMMGRVGGG